MKQEEDTLLVSVGTVCGNPPSSLTKACRAVHMLKSIIYRRALMKNDSILSALSSSQQVHNL